MPPQLTTRRKQNTVAYKANGKSRIDLEIGDFYRELYLNLNVSIDADAGDAVDAANVLRGDEWGVVKNIKVTIGNNTVIREFSGEELRVLNTFMYGNPPYLPLAPGISAGATLAMQSTLLLPFWHVGTMGPVVGQLDARRLANFSLEIEWGDVADITSATSAAFTSDPSIEVSSYNANGFEGSVSGSIIDKVYSKSNLAANSKETARITPEGVYRAFLFHATNSSAADLADAINNIKIRSGPNVYYDMECVMQQQIAYQKYGIRQTLDDAGTALDSVFVSDASDLDAWVYVDLVDPIDGYQSEGIDAQVLGQLDIEMDIDAINGNLDILSWQILPVRK